MGLLIAVQFVVDFPNASLRFVVEDAGEIIDEAKRISKI